MSTYSDERSDDIIVCRHLDGVLLIKRRVQKTGLTEMNDWLSLTDRHVTALFYRSAQTTERNIIVTNDRWI